MLQGLGLGLVVVGLAALERQELAVIGNRLVAVAFELESMPAIGIGAGKLGIEAYRLIEIGKSEIEQALVHVDPAAGVDRIWLIGEDGHGALGIGKRLVEIALLGIGPGAAVKRPAIVGLCRKHLVKIGEGAVEIALVVEDGGVVGQDLDIVGAE